MKAQSKEQYVKAWQSEARSILNNVGNDTMCSDLSNELFIRMRKTVHELKTQIAEAGDLLEKEGTWKD